MFPIIGDAAANIALYLSSKQQEELQTLVPDFARILKQAKLDFAKFQAGENYFTKQQHDKIQDWFRQFPELWKGIKPNFEFTPDGLVSTHQQALIADADNFVKLLQNSLTTYQPADTSRLGLATIVIAGIIVAVSFGIGGIIWAIGYVKEQQNISFMVEEVTAGRLDPAVLQAAIDKSGGGIFEDVTGIMKYGIMAAGIFLAWPLLSKLGSGK